MFGEPHQIIHAKLLISFQRKMLEATVLEPTGLRFTEVHSAVSTGFLAPEICHVHQVFDPWTGSDSRECGVVVRGAHSVDGLTPDAFQAAVHVIVVDV